MPIDFGEPAPFFIAKASNDMTLSFGNLAGYIVLLVFVGSEPTGVRRIVEEVNRHRAAFNDKTLMLFYLVSDADQLAAFGIAHSEPGIRFVLDRGRHIATTFGYGSENSTNVVLLDRTLRCVMSVAVKNDRVFEIDPIIEAATAMQAWSPEVSSGAPVLVLDRILEPELCSALIDYYVARGGTDSGLMKEINGSIVVRKDPRIKRSLDCTIEDRTLLDLLTSRLQKRLRPMILRSYQCNVTQVEHHVVTRYDAADGGFFRRHRANTSKDTAHLRFAIAINLNAENYEGGDLWFPEFGHQTYRASTGGAVVFACSLLHEDLPVNRGVRYAYLPFLSDGEHGKMHHNIKRSSIGMFPLADPNGSYGRT